MAAVTVLSDFGNQENKICHCFHFLPIYLPWSECWVLGQLFHSLFHLHQDTFSSLTLSSIRVVLSAYLRLLIFLPATLIPVCGPSSPTFHMMYSAYKLNKHSDNIQLCHTSFPFLKQSIVLCLVLTAASWLAYRFLRRQVRWSGILISLWIFHRLLWSIQPKAFS